MIMLTQTKDIDSIRKNISSSPRLACFIYSNLFDTYKESSRTFKQSFDDHLRAINEFNDNDVIEAFESWDRYKLEGPICEGLKGHTRLINFVQSYLHNIIHRDKLPIVLSEDKYVQVRALLDIAQMKSGLLFSDFSAHIIEVLNHFEKNKNQTSWIHFKNEQHVDWVMDYISKHQFKRRVSLNKNQNHIEDVFPDKPSHHVNTLDKKKNFIEYFFDTLPYLTNQDYAENFLIKIKRANSQRKYRNENAERVASNYMLRKDIKIKLKEISKKERLNLNETIELLIEQAHSKLKGTS